MPPWVYRKARRGQSLDLSDPLPLDSETKKKMDIDALVANIDKIQFQHNLGADFDKRGIEMWERAKARVKQ